MIKSVIFDLDDTLYDFSSLHPGALKQVATYAQSNLGLSREDFDALQREGIEKTIREQFIPWLKGEQFPEKKDDLVYEGLHLTEILYHYGRIIARYSPTGKDEQFGQFEFQFDSCSAYTEDMLEAVAMQVYVKDGRIVKVSGYDV